MQVAFAREVFIAKNTTASFRVIIPVEISNFYCKAYMKVWKKNVARWNCEEAIIMLALHDSSENFAKWDRWSDYCFVHSDRSDFPDVDRQLKFNVLM